MMVSFIEVVEAEGGCTGEAVSRFGFGHAEVKIHIIQ